jgi:hypothetical protein
MRGAACLSRQLAVEAGCLHVRPVDDGRAQPGSGECLGPAEGLVASNGDAVMAASVPRAMGKWDLPGLSPLRRVARLGAISGTHEFAVDMGRRHADAAACPCPISTADRYGSRDSDADELGMPVCCPQVFLCERRYCSKRSLAKSVHG